jgi:predicted enzyme related to lactoylglutathione lyase
MPTCTETAMPDRQIITVAPNFIVDDIVPAAEFYRDKLGFKFDRFWGEPPCFVMVRRDGITIMLASFGKKGVAKPNRQVDPEGCWDAYIWVRDAQVLYDEFQAKGVTIARPIEKSHYGCLDFEILDSSGYCLCFGQDLGPNQP